MTQYRIKEKNGYFYPQEKNGFITFWCWVCLYRPAHEQYKNVSLENFNHPVWAFFFSLEEAKEFIEKVKKKREIIIHKV